MATGSCGVAELSDSDATTDWSGTGPDTALTFGGLAYLASGPLGTQAITTDGSTGWAETTVPYSNPESFTILAWFKTSTDQGSIVGFAANQTAPSTTSSSNDRILWIDPTGHLVWGVYNGADKEVTSSSTYANGSWHFVAATIGSGGQKLYVDGGLVASSSNTSAQTGYSGYWDIGTSGVWISGWNDYPASPYFEGSIAQVAVIPSQISSTQVSNLYADSTLSTYEAGVNALGPANDWPLNDSGATPYEGSIPGATSSTTLNDASGDANTAVAEGGVTLGASGPPAIGGSGIALDGSSGFVESSTSYDDPEDLSLVAWFKTTTTSGGNIVGFTNLQGDSAPGDSDRLLWIDNSGKVVWAVYPHTDQVLTSSSSYNDGLWHMVVAEIGPSGQQLWIDGVQVAINASVTSAQVYTGYWHLGWGSETYWSDQPSDYFMAGSLAEVAVIPSQLNSSQIAVLFNASSTAAIAVEIGDLSPTSYWPLQDSASGICGTSEITVQQSVGATNTCLYPAATGSCPATTSTYLVTGLGIRSMVAPTSSTAVVITIKMKLSSASPTGVAGLHELADIGFGTAKPATLWTAQIAYPTASVLL